MADKVVTYTVKIDAKSTAPQASDSVKELRDRMTALQAVIKSQSQSMRQLRGSTTEVKAAKDALKQSTSRLKDELSANTLALAKTGASLKEVAKGAKEAKDGISLLAVGAGVAAVSIAGLAVKAFGLIESFARFGLESADAARTQNILQEAVTGSAEDALHLTHQIDALAEKVPTARAELNGLALELERTFQGSYLGGAGIVDAFNAIGQAAAINGDKAGNAIKSILERGKTTGRLQIGGGLQNGIDELQGTGAGVTRDNVATQLAKNLGIGLTQARNALALGTVRLEDGAKALRGAVESKLGPLNSRLTSGLSAQIGKIWDQLHKLASSVNIQPFLDQLTRLREYLDEARSGGQGLKAIFEGFGAILGAPFKKGGLEVEDIVDQIEIFALKSENAILEFENNWKGLPDLLGSILPALEGIGEAIGAAIARGFAGAGKDAIANVAGIGTGHFLGINWGFLGNQAASGLAKGMDSGRPLVKDASGGLTMDSIQAVKDGYQVRSPSRVMADIGRNVAAGLAAGIDDGAKSVDSAVGGLGPKSIDFGGKGGRGLGGQTSADVKVTFNFPSVKDAEGVASTVQSASFRAALTKAVEEMLLGAGVPTQAAP